ncbi:MAG: hypothetical protein MZW92_01580 [Comamonadaceae bacterium]|nr:hypothetical protein [Comamonadaceae bacterium]
MILKGVDVLPHALINNVDEKLGRDGEKLREYVALAGPAGSGAVRPDPAYRPTLHIDVYGTIGADLRPERPARSPITWPPSEADAGEFPLYIEGPVDAEEKRRADRAARRRSERPAGAAASAVKIVADEWCNTYEDVRDFTDAGLLRHGPDQDARPGRHPEHDRERPLLPDARHGGLPGRHLQRDRCLGPGLRPRGRGRAAPNGSWPSPAWASTRAS